MKARIFSKICIHPSRRISIRTSLAALAIACGSHYFPSLVSAGEPPTANASGLYTDPQTGIVYRKVIKTVERPVVETKVETRNQTVYRPETVTETKPENRTVYSPVVEYKWEPRLHGRWNPFQQPTVAYHHVPHSRWEARNQVVRRTEKRTEWVAENRTVDVPQRIVRMQREQKVEYEAVGKIAPPAANPPGPSSALAARLRPLDSRSQVTPMSPSRYAAGPLYTAPNFNAPRFNAGGFDAPKIAASTVGRMTSDPPRRNSGQAGMRVNNLYPTGRGISQPLPPSSAGGGIANLPSLPFMR